MVLKKNIKISYKIRVYYKKIKQNVIASDER